MPIWPLQRPTLTVSTVVGVPMAYVPPFSTAVLAMELIEKNT